jgi:TetR/AcrR family transcriptional regulator, repressor for uid operon
MSPAQHETDGRVARRMATRAKLLAAAGSEFERTGLADGDVGAIAAAAGVARTTFYSHFPTKEHVVLALEREAEQRIAEELARFLTRPHDLAEVLHQVVRLVVAARRQLGPLLFKDVLALHFSSGNLPEDEWTDHPVIVCLVEAVRQRRDTGEVDAAVDPFHSTLSFLLGLHGLLSNSRSVRPSMLDSYVATALRGIVAR